MEERRKEVEFDEFEMLLGEIPNATYGNPNSEDSGPRDSMDDFTSMPFDDRLSTDRHRPLSVNSSKGSFRENTQNNNGPDDGTVSVNKFQQSPIKRVQAQGPSLPDDQSLTSTFAGLSFSSGVRIEAANPPLVNYTSVPSHSILPDGEHTKGLNNSPKGDCRVMAAPSPHPPINTSNAFSDFDVKKTSNLSGLGLQEFRKQQVGHFQPIENVSDTFQFGHGAQGFELHSNVHVPGLEFSATPDHAQYSSDLQSTHPYLHSQQLNQSHISLRHMEEEQYYRMQQHYMYLQQLYNHRLEALHPIQANGNPARLVSRKPRQLCFEMSHQLEQFNQEPRSNNFAPMGFNRYNPARSSRGLNSMQVLDKLGKQHIPEKILTRSHGLNSIRDVKFGSFRENESLHRVHQNGKVFSNGHFNAKDAGCFYYDSLSWQGSSLDIADVKSTSPKLHPQRYNSLDEVAGRIYFMAKDQHGCRFLQRKISEGNPDDVERIFIEIIDHIVELMTDPFGNYLIQKLLEVCNEDQRTQIIVFITRKDVDLVRISCDMHGTRAVQKVVETLRTPEQFSMVVSSLKPGIVTLIMNMNGNHVAQRCLQYLVPEHREFLFEAATNHCVELATDRHGCCVLQKCLSHSDDKQRRRLVYEIASNALILSQDPYGNYVVQCIFDLRLPWATVDILNQLEGNYWDLSIQKYSSNVVEKCLKYADEDGRLRIVQELINNPRLDQIMQDPYGNYVIQAALSHSKVRRSINNVLVNDIGTPIMSSCTPYYEYMWYPQCTHDVECKRLQRECQKDFPFCNGRTLCWAGGGDHTPCSCAPNQSIWEESPL